MQALLYTQHRPYPWYECGKKLFLIYRSHSFHLAAECQSVRRRVETLLSWYVAFGNLPFCHYSATLSVSILYLFSVRIFREECRCHSMKIPADAIIPEEKITRYLLLPKLRNDKSKYLAQAGFTQINPEALREALWLLVQTFEALPEKSTEYGTVYTVEGVLIGTNGTYLPVVTVWLHRTVDDLFQFVTLKPSRGVFHAG